MNTTLAVITALGTLATVIGGVVLQVIAALRNGKKLDENTAVTKAAAKQIDEVHAATNVLAAATSGTYKALIEPDAK